MGKYGKPEPVEGKCNAWLILADDHGDNDCTFQCNLEAGHVGAHGESFNRHMDMPVEVKWLGDDKIEFEQDEQAHTLALELDELISKDRLNEMDAILSKLEPEKIAKHLLRVYVEITEDYRDKLPSRAAFVERAKAVLGEGIE